VADGEAASDCGDDEGGSRLQSDINDDVGGRHQVCIEEDTVGGCTAVKNAASASA